MEKTFVLKDPEATRAFGKELAARLAPGTVIALTGDLGAGKTTLTKAVAEGLGIREEVTSPTFTIVREYRGGRLPLYHFDVYRVHDADELFEIGFEDYVGGDGACLIEWAELLEDGMLPESAIRIRLEYGEDDNERILTLTC